MIRRALVSVSNKDNLETLAEILKTHNIVTLSTGGTASALRALGVTVTDVADVTGLPEMMDGRVKTLHPKIHGGILARRDTPTHMEDLKKHAIPEIDLVVVNLYPFEETLKTTKDPETLIENIDIGGPAMVRASAKNHAFVTILTNPKDYTAFAHELKLNNGNTSLLFREEMAAKAFSHTSYYDSLIARWLTNKVMHEKKGQNAHHEHFTRLTLPMLKMNSLRYGENPHQHAALYADIGSPQGFAAITQHQGKELSYNNINDTDAALSLISEFPFLTKENLSQFEGILHESRAPYPYACAIIKHANPCGVATGTTLLEAYERALSADPVSAFGGIIALNAPIDKDTATAIAKIFTEVIIAPDATEDAKNIIREKKNLRLLTLKNWPSQTLSKLEIKSVLGGYLMQTRDNEIFRPKDWQIVTKRKPTEQEISDLIFAYTVAKHVKSNTIVYAKKGRTRGIGAGQMSRIDAAKMGVMKAEEMVQANLHREFSSLHERDSMKKYTPAPLQDSVAASDAFFPFADGLDVIINAGCTAVIQPGGSMRDSEVIKAADDAHLAMIFTGMRHFKH